MDAQLLDAWCRTDYVVRVAGREFTFRLGVTNARNDEFLTGQGINCWAIVTGWNPAAQRSSMEENETAHRRLIDELRQRGLSWSLGDGHPPDDDWHIERGCFIRNISAEEAAELCRQFGQLAAVVGRPGERPRLVFGNLATVRAGLEKIARSHSDEFVRQVAEDALRPESRDGVHESS